jgi:hypothetical protein
MCKSKLLNSFIAQNSGTIKNLYFDNTCFFMQSIGNRGVGSICALNDGAIINCKSAATVVGHWYVGGICGICYSQGKIENCMFYGKVIGRKTIGGICGEMYGNGKRLKNSGVVLGEDYIGGICGLCNSGHLRRLLNNGYICTWDSEHIDQIVGLGEYSKLYIKKIEGQIVYVNSPVFEKIINKKEMSKTINFLQYGWEEI